jgi:biotin-(acetyl-CoA carboxylase) ligase
LKFYSKGEEPILPCVAEQGKGRSLFYHVWHNRERGGAYFTMCGRARKEEEPILPYVAEQRKGRSLFYHVWQSRERGGAYFTMCGRA